MDLGDLTIFRAVVHAGGITRAAEKLHRVQSNVTTRVRQLEQDLGVELFIREGKKLHLSPAGRLLLGYADRLIALAQEAREALHESVPRGVLRLGSMESTAAMRLPEPLNLYHHRYPEVTLELRTATIRELCGAVLNGEIDAALVAEPISDAGLDKAVIYDEELAFIAPVEQPPIRSPRDIEPHAVLAFESGCPYRLRLEQWFAQTGEAPPRIVEMTSWHAILGCAAAGMGVAVLPKMVLATFPQRTFLRVHPLPKAFSHAPTVLIWRKDTHAPKVAALRDVLTAHATDIAAAPATPKTAGKRAVKGTGRRRANGSAKAA
jgi:DNA-binding transcriptional LysR family regulator